MTWRRVWGGNSVFPSGWDREMQWGNCSIPSGVDEEKVEQAMASSSREDQKRGIDRNGTLFSGRDWKRGTGENGIALTGRDWERSMREWCILFRWKLWQACRCNSIFPGSDLEGAKGAIASSSQRLEGLMGQGEKCHLQVHTKSGPCPWGREDVEGRPQFCTHIANTSGPQGRGQRGDTDSVLGC